MLCRLILSQSGLKNQSIRILSTQTQNVTIYERSKAKLFEVMSIYEEAIGIKEVKQAQDLVQNAEKNFSTLQEERRRLNLQLIEAQQKLRQIRDEMDRLNRTDSSYLKLFTEEHGLLKLESRLVSDYKLKEEEERAAFFHLSSALRDAQQKERIRVERMKYLQLGLSILCTSLGLLSAYLLNYFRNSNIREILEYDKEHFKALEDSVKTIIEKQEGLGTNFETMITKWNKSFKPPDGSQTVEQIAQTNSIPISIVEASEDDDSEQARSLNKYYANAALLSVILLIPMFYYFKNK